jgi:hypothetical protein
MEKKYIIGGLALVGVVLVYNYFAKPRKNSEGFFSATGNVSGNCAKRNSDGSVSYYTETLSDTCRKGWTRVKSFGDRENL